MWQSQNLVYLIANIKARKQFFLLMNTSYKGVAAATEKTVIFRKQVLLKQMP